MVPDAEAVGDEGARVGRVAVAREEELRAAVHRAVAGRRAAGEASRSAAGRGEATGVAVEGVGASDFASAAPRLLQTLFLISCSSGERRSASSLRLVRTRTRTLVGWVIIPAVAYASQGYQTAEAEVAD